MSEAKMGSGRTWVAVWIALVAFAAPLAGQGLADYDYTNLSFRGIGVDWGYLYPSRVNPTQSLGVRMDLGFLGPGVRIVPGVTYWSSTFRGSEVAKLESRVQSLIERQTGSPPPPVDLGTIRWSDVAISLDADVVWRVPLDLYSSLGMGLSAHVLRGSGAAVDGTFVQDLLNTVSAGLDAHAGLEYPLRPWIRLYGQARYDLVENLRYFQLRLGAEFMLHKSGEEGGGTR